MSELAQTETWLNREEAAKHINHALPTFDKLVKVGKIKAYRPTRKPLFSKRELDIFVMKPVLRKKTN